MYVHPVTLANKAMIKKMKETMSPDDIKQEKKNYVKNRQFIRQQNNKYKNKNKFNIRELYLPTNINNIV